MTFEAGPWQCFGIELLDRLNLLVGQKHGGGAASMGSASAINAGTTTITTAAAAVYPPTKGPRTDSIPCTMPAAQPSSTAVASFPNARTSQGQLQQIQGLN